jgi:hypothetical protein
MRPYATAGPACQLCDLRPGCWFSWLRMPGFISETAGSFYLKLTRVGDVLYYDSVFG